MKRANGTGTVVRKNGRSKPYEVYGGAFFEDGKRHIPYLGSFRTSKEAHQALERYNAMPGSSERFKMTFSEVWEEFTGGKRYLKLSKSMQDNYKASYKKCVLLHHKRFCEIRLPQMQNIIDGMEMDGSSVSSMNKVKILLNLLSKYAIASDIAVKNYAQGIVLPNMEQSEKRPLSDFEVEKIRLLSETDDTAKILLYLIYSGWRISECLELTAFSYNREGKYFTGGKKTEYGKNRVVPVHPAVQPIVDYFLMRNGKTVFCRSDGSEITPNYFRAKMLKPFLEKNKFEAITPHQMRHTFATRLKKNGADDFYRKCLLGHSHGNITDDVYTHEDIESLRRNILFVEPQKKNDEKTQKESA